MRQFLAALAILLLLAGAGMYAAGWLRFDREPGRTTIEINTEKLDETADQLAEESRELVNQAADSVEQATEERDAERRVEIEYEAADRRDNDVR